MQKTDDFRNPTTKPVTADEAPVCSLLKAYLERQHCRTASSLGYSLNDPVGMRQYIWAIPATAHK